MFDETTRHKLGSCSKIKSGMSDVQKSVIFGMKNPELDRMINAIKTDQPEAFLMSDADLENRVFLDEPASPTRFKNFVRPYQPEAEL